MQITHQYTGAASIVNEEIQNLSHMGIMHVHSLQDEYRSGGNE